MVTIIFVLPFNALLKSSEVESSSKTTTSPAGALKCLSETASCNCLSTTILSVIIIIVSNILTSLSCNDFNKCDNQAIVLVLPEPAECSIK